METYSPFDKVQKDNTAKGGDFDKNAYKALKKAALEKRNEIRTQRKELTKAQKDEMATLKNNYKAQMAAIKADQKSNDPQTETPGQDEKERLDKLYAEKKEIKDKFKAEKKDKTEAYRATRKALKGQIAESMSEVKKHQMSEEEQKDLLNKRILNLQIKFLKKFNEAPLDLFTEYQKQNAQDSEDKPEHG